MARQPAGSPLDSSSKLGLPSAAMLRSAVTAACAEAVAGEGDAESGDDVLGAPLVAVLRFAFSFSRQSTDKGCRAKHTGYRQVLCSSISMSTTRVLCHALHILHTKENM